MGCVESVTSPRGMGFMFGYRLTAVKSWLRKCSPSWSECIYTPVEYHSYSYYSYSISDNRRSRNGLDVGGVFSSLGVGVDGGTRGKIAFEKVLDSVSVNTTFFVYLSQMGVVFRSL